MSDQHGNQDESRRQFVKKAVYVTPVIVTLEAIPSIASTGSHWNDNGRGQGQGRGRSGAPGTGRGRGRAD